MWNSVMFLFWCVFVSDVSVFFQTIGGNIMTASPISDLNPVFMAAGCKLTLMSKGKPKIFFVVSFWKFKGYLDPWLYW